MFEVFQSVGKWPVDRLNRLWSEDDIENAMFLSVWEAIPSGPVEVLTLRGLSNVSTSTCVHSIVDRLG